MCGNPRAAAALVVAERGSHMPFMLALFLYALLNSAFVTLRQGGIRWRDTFYPLDTLRTGNVR